MENINHNQLRQTTEEERAIAPVYAEIVREFIALKHIGSDSKKPDFKLNYNGLNICIEMTRIEPYINRGLESQCVIQSAVDKLIREVIKKNNINPFCTIHVIIGPTLQTLKKREKLKNVNNIEQIILRALKGRVNREIFKEFKVNRKIGNVRQMKDKKYIAMLTRVLQRYSGKTFPEISFSNPGGVLVPLSESDISKAIAHKEGKYFDYKENREESFDEVWLCLYIPASEHGFTIRGAAIPHIESKYDRIYLSEEKFHFSRLIYNKRETPNLDI